jgi:hypothetical protein
MIEQLPESAQQALVFRITGTLTAEDYESRFIPAIESALKKYGKISSLVHFDADFKGLELAAAWDDARFGTRHRNDFIRLAVVGAPQWMTWGVKVAKHFMEGDVRCFSGDEYEALHWMQTGESG